MSFLFNWPSTGGGIVHTVELCDFLQRAGYEVEHFYAHYDPWELGVVKQATPMKSHALHFHDSDWSLPGIQQRYRVAVTAFQPDYVIVTDSWNMKPVLAEAVEQFPYILRLQALECLCPLNNIRLLPDGQGGLRQCQLHQLATPDQCRECVSQNGQRSGSLHRHERQLAEVASPKYETRLKKVFRQAHAVLVVNPLTEAMVAPYSTRVCTVTAGMDPARFPEIWPDDPAPESERPMKQILFAGLIDETIKGFGVLHEACQRLSKKRQDFELLVTADPIGRIDSITRTVGWQTQDSLPRIMRGADIVAVPAVAQEALGRTAVEAMGAGRPVVASRLGGLPFTIPDGATGLLFEPGNPDDLATKLEQLLNSVELRTRLGNAGRQRFLEHYAWPVIIEKHYLPLLGAPRS
ncbi:MAG: glycosyltransferase family 4 protein [Gemmatales bacterium]